MFTFIDPIRRCRNEGGHDSTVCSAVDTFPIATDSTKQYHPVCGDYIPTFQTCHISALNGEGNEPHFAFTKHSFFNAESAREVCNKIGGHLPILQQELDSIWLQKSMEDLSSFVTLGWPFSLKWLSWPVSNIICIPKKNLIL